MMTNLFSIFDPQSCFSISTNWLIIIMLILVLPAQMWTIKTSLYSVLLNLMTKLYKDLSVILLYPSNKTNSAFLLSLFMVILLNNSIPLWSYIFNSTSHLSISMTMSLPIWLGIMMFSMVNFTSVLLSHLVPQGTPAMLMPLMVMIESTSMLIRPATLAIRLTANMIAGHLLLVILGNQLDLASSTSYMILFLTQASLLTLEMGVAMIQSYVFVTLNTLYISEI